MKECPMCGYALAYDSLELNELVPCPECGSDLEVLSLEPLSFGMAPTEKEDWGE